MKAKDLMIGDWVYIHHGGKATHYGKVTALLPSGAIESEIDGSHALSSSVEPIPLTQEILEKNGFKDIDKEEHCEGYDIYWTNGDGYSINVQDLHLHYVHELQHALRLCGIDKEIVV